MYIIHKDPQRIPIQQGTIINGCVADNYDCNVYGLIITPRCDIDNGGKVSTIHYLPIVSLNDWMKVDCIVNATKKMARLLQVKLQQYQISDTILRHFISNDDILLLLKSVNANERQVMVNLYEGYKNVVNKKDYSSVDFQKLCREEFKELCKGRNNRFYLIKNWDSTNQFKVVILRDVRRVSLPILQKFVNGYRNSNFSEEDYKCNDIVYTDQRLYFTTITQIASPYIEHIIQAFSHNFCRIGVQDLFSQQEIIEQYKNYIF